MKPCKRWEGLHFRAGYARTSADLFRVWGQCRVTRHILCERYGRKLDRNEWACHTCDNKWCVEPSHIYLGTPKDNRRDTMTRFPGIRGKLMENLDKRTDEGMQRSLKAMQFAASQLTPDQIASRNEKIRQAWTPEKRREQSERIKAAKRKV